MTRDDDTKGVNDPMPGVLTDAPFVFDDDAAQPLPGNAADRGDGPPPRTAERSARARARRRRWAVVAVVGTVLFASLAAAGWFAWQLNPPGDPGADVAVQIEPGWGAREAGDALADAGVIDSSLVFRVWARVSGRSTFQAGTYQFREDLGVDGALDVLHRGPDANASADFKLLLPPGLRLTQIADRVGQLPGHSRDAFLQLATTGAVRSKYQPPDQPSVEGLTWPDTYFVGKTQSDADVLRTIVTAFDAHADAAGLAGAPINTQGALTPYQAVVSASLVQAEAGSADMANVSGVIVNRLRKGMPLQIDATLCYLKGGCPPVPNNTDKTSTSPYNTYRVTGLPPTPIMTVTDAALRAALHPAAVPYLYYVTGKDGVTRFATTQAEHDQNIREHGVRGE